MDYHLLTKKCDGMCDSCECPPAEFECQGEPALCDNPRGCACAPEPTLKPDRTAAWYMDVVWPLLPVPGEFDGMDACDQLRWRSVVRLAIEYVLCGERGTPPSSKTPHCPKGDEPCIRGCKGWECRDGWPDDPALKPDIAALKKRLAEDPGFAAQVTGDRPLRRNVDGVCTRSTCECERDGLGDQCVWLKPVDAQEHVERLSQYVMQQDMRIADLERDAMRYRFIRTADHVPISSEAARDPVAYDAAIDREMAKNLPPSCKTRAGCSENGCLGWCDEYKP